MSEVSAREPENNGHYQYKIAAFTKESVISLTGETWKEDSTKSVLCTDEEDCVLENGIKTAHLNKCVLENTNLKKSCVDINDMKLISACNPATVWTPSSVTSEQTITPEEHGAICCPRDSYCPTYSISRSGLESPSDSADVQENQRYELSGTNFAQTAKYITRTKLQFQGEDTSENERQECKENIKYSYSKRYGINPKHSFPTLKHSRAIDVVHQWPKVSRLWTVHVVSKEVDCTVPVGNKNVSKARPIRKASVLNMSLSHNIHGEERAVGEDTESAEESYGSYKCLLKKSSCILKSRATDIANSDALTGKGYCLLNSDDFRKNNKTNKIKYYGKLSPAWQLALKGTGVKETKGCQDVLQRYRSYTEAGHNRLTVIRGISDAPDNPRLGLKGVQWPEVKQVILSGHCRETSTLKTGDLMVRKSDLAQHNHTEISAIKHTAPQRPILRQSSRSKQMVPKPDTTVDDETGAEPQPAATSLIEDPILVKVSKRNRNVGKFTCKPESIPHAVCFEIPGTDLKHQDVKLQVETFLQNCPEVKIVSIQFHHRALVNNQKEMNNRWIITTNSAIGRDQLTGNDLTFGNQVVELRNYDEVISTEYQQFVRITNFVKMMDHRKILT